MTLPDDIEDMLQDLATTDGVFAGIQIHDPDVGKQLEARGLALKNQKGHYYGTDLLRYMLDSAGMETVLIHAKEK